MTDRRKRPPRAAIGEFSLGLELSAVSMEGYTTRRERAALRCALHDATILADQVAAKIEADNTVRRKLTKKGAEQVALAKMIADLIWQMRNEIVLPAPKRTRDAR